MNIFKRKKLEKILEEYYNCNEEEINDRANEIYNKFGTGKNCPHCGKQLIESDLKDYKYLCINCDENFYKIEVE